jgi:hypothetical protein
LRGKLGKLTACHDPLHHFGGENPLTEVSHMEVSDTVGMVTDGRRSLVTTESGPAHLCCIGIVFAAAGIFSRT